MTKNGSCRRSKPFKRAQAAADARQICTRPYRPQSNGKAKGFIRTAKRGQAYA